MWRTCLANVPLITLKVSEVSIIRTHQDKHFHLNARLSFTRDRLPSVHWRKVGRNSEGEAAVAAAAAAAAARYFVTHYRMATINRLVLAKWSQEL